MDNNFFGELYEIALQGTSGQYDDPKKAAETARVIADKARSAVEELNKLDGSHAGLLVTDFKSALQGTASKYSDAQKAVDKAKEMAIAAQDAVAKEQAKIHAEDRGS